VLFHSTPGNGWPLVGSVRLLTRQLDVDTRRDASGLREFARVDRDLAVVGGRVAVATLEDVRLARLERVLPRGRPLAVGRYRDVGARQSLAFGRMLGRTIVARNLAVVGGRVVVVVALDDVVLTRHECIFPDTVPARLPARDSGMCGQLVVVALGKFVADALAAEFAHGALQSSTVCGRVAIVALEFDVLTRIKILLMCIDASFTRESCGGEGHVAVGWVTNFTFFLCTMAY